MVEIREIGDDGLIYIFRLVQNAAFYNGDPVLLTLSLPLTE